MEPSGFHGERFSSRIFPTGAFIHFAAMSVERNTQVSTASVPAAGFFFRGNLLTHAGFHGEHFSSSSFWMGAFTSDAMSAEWHAGVSMVGVSAAGFFSWEPSLTAVSAKNEAFSSSSFFMGAFTSHVMSQAFPRRPFQQQDVFHGALHMWCLKDMERGVSTPSMSAAIFFLGAFTSRANMFVIKTVKHVGIRRRYSTNTCQTTIRMAGRPVN